jgi:hypothetical protein
MAGAGRRVADSSDQAHRNLFIYLRNFFSQKLTIPKNSLCASENEEVGAPNQPVHHVGTSKAMRGRLNIL